MSDLGTAVIVGKCWIKILSFPTRDTEDAENDNSQNTKNHNQQEED